MPVIKIEMDPYGRIIDQSQNWYRIFVSALAWAIVLALYIFYVPSHVSPLKLPGPLLVIGAMNNLGVELIWHSLSTLVRVLIGFFIGSSLGIVVGLVMYANRTLDSVFFPFIEFIRPVPPIALIPFFILWFQLNPAGQLLLISLGCFMVLVVSTREALHKVSIDIKRAACSLGARGMQYYCRVLLWAITPSLTAPLRVALALAFALAIASEFMGAQFGIGFLMMVARRTLQTETILLGVFIIGIEAALLDYLLRAVMRRLTRWHT